MAINSPLPSIHVSISDIGGIDTTEREIPPGVTVLSGENATNRSSFLRAIATVFGGEHAFVKGDAPEGNATISIADQQFSRTVTRQGQGVTYQGEPYLSDPDAIAKAELFAFLLQDNPIRQYVRSKQGSLRDILMEPVDTDAIERQTETLLNERRGIQDKLESAEKRANELATHRSKQEQLETEIESLEREITELEAEIRQADQDLESITDDETELQDARERASTLRADRNSLEETIQKKRDELETVRETLDGLSEPDVDTASLESRREQLQAERSKIQEQISHLESDIKEPLIDIRSVLGDIQHDSSQLVSAIAQLSSELDLSGGPLSELPEETDPTDQLVGAGEGICLACGSPIEDGQLDSLDDQYAELIQTVDTVISERKNERNDIETEISDIEEDLHKMEAYTEQVAKLERKETMLENDLESTETQLLDVKSELETQQEKIQELGHEETQEILALKEQLAEKRSKREYTQKQLAELEEQITKAKRKQQQITEHEQRLEEIADELDTLRGRVGDLERSLRAEFNRQMATVLDILEFENIRKIEITEQKKTVREGRRNVEKTVFTLQITRTGDEGEYRGSLAQLSESEREIVGLVIGLTGYLVHDVSDVCPVMLLDSIDALDAIRQKRLLEHMSEHQEYLVAAVLPEEGSVLAETDEFNIIEW